MEIEKTFTICEHRMSKRGGGCGNVCEEILHTGTFAELAKALHVETPEDMHFYHDLPWSTRAPKTVRGIVGVLNKATHHNDVIANKQGFGIQAWSEWTLE